MRAAATSSSGFPSDMNLLVESCIARVRATACLDDDAVLPPLPIVAPRRDVVVFTKSQTAAAAAVGAAPVEVAVVPPRSRSAHRASWPLLLCAFVASLAGGAALLSSPAGQRPGVRRVTHSARAHASHAAHATMSLFSAGAGADR